MMSSQSVPSHFNPVFPCKMPFDRTVTSTGPSNPKNMSDFLGKQMLQYSGPYITYDPRVKDAAQLTPSWSNSKNSLLDGRRSVSHLSGMEGENHIIYREDSISSEEGHSHSSPLHQAPVKQGFMLYTKSPGNSSTTATSVAVGKQKHRSDCSSEKVYLTIPKPVYGHNPCCDELGCVRGQRYSMEYGSLGIPNTVYKHNWMQTDAPYSERAPIQKKAENTVLQHGGLQFQPSAEHLKRIPVETYSPGRARTLPAIIEPNNSSYPCTLARTLFGSLSEQSQQTSPRGYSSLYPSHHTYEHMTSEIYQEHSPMSKYGHLTQHPMFYYGQGDAEVESRTQFKDTDIKPREDVPVMLNPTISTPRDHYMVPHPLYSDISLPFAGTETYPNHLMQAFGFPCFAVPRFHLNASQSRLPLKRQHASPSLQSHNHLNVTPSSQCMDYPMASATSLHKVKSNSGLHVDQSHNSPFLRVSQTSPIRCTSQPDVSPSSIKMNRLFPPFSTLNIEQPCVPTPGLTRNRFLDYSSYESQTKCPKQPKGHPVSPVAQLPQSPHHNLDRINMAVHNNSNVRKIIYSPAVAPGRKHNDPISSSGSKGHLKRSVSHSLSPIKIKDEKDLCEVDLLSKRQKVEMDVQLGKKMDSPPMPVIDNVFSLAPYQAHLQASGVFFSDKVPQRSVQSPEQLELKTKPDITEKRKGRDENQPFVCGESKEICANKPVVEILEPKNIKLEKEASDTDSVVETPVSCRDSSMIAFNTEPKETGSSNSGHMLIKKSDHDELESKPSVVEKNETSDESKPAEESAQIKTSHQDDTCTLHEQNTFQPKSETPSQPTERRLNFKNIPPHCLKLSNYKFVLRDARPPSLGPPSEKPCVQPTTVCIPKLDLQMPVRKHFFELHHSLHKLISKSVLASPEQKLRTWLSQLELGDPASSSPKFKKVSCLFGVKARELWLNEEIKLALQDLLQRLSEYTAQERCPFPHVMRAGAVFVPMLVVKELLFPMVQGNYIDQVLQEHKVELRPTTLSEEKILIQLHKRVCSSKLRRLMSLKHLPDIYADVVNLLYYACVSKHLGLDMDVPASRVKDEVCEEIIGMTPVSHDITPSPASPAESHSLRTLTDQKKKSNLNSPRRKSRVKSSSRRLFLDDGLSDEEKVDDRTAINAFGDKNLIGHKYEWAENEGNDCMDAEQDCSLIPLSMTYENSWTCPLTFDELSPSPCDPETKDYSSVQPVSQSPGPAESAVRSNNCSGMILKLRRLFSEGLNRQKDCYQAISDSRTFADLSLSQINDGDGEVSSNMDTHRRLPEITQRWQRTEGFSRALRPHSSSSKKKCRSLLKIKYCPYLSACHSADRKRRWVLRSAVRKAQRAMRFYYPDLVGKRIRHLYEEDDKSEVWYRGEVLRVHEANTNPLKTIFEVRYDSEPEWKYYLELLIDYKKGWLKIED